MADSPDPADAAFAALASAPPPGSRWRHRKGGLYTVTGAAVIEASLTPAVVYRDAAGRSWVRSLALFTDGRFTRVEGDGI
jgi:hypothetical protein